MATKLIRLADGVLVEVEVPPDEAQPISGGLADKVGESLSQITPLLRQVCQSIGSTWDEMNADVDVEKAEIELGVSFEGEGNLYVTKAKAGASMTVKLILLPKTRKTDGE